MRFVEHARRPWVSISHQNPAPSIFTAHLPSIYVPYSPPSSSSCSSSATDELTTDSSSPKKTWWYTLKQTNTNRVRMDECYVNNLVLPIPMGDASASLPPFCEDSTSTSTPISRPPPSSKGKSMGTVADNGSSARNPCHTFRSIKSKYRI